MDFLALSFRGALCTCIVITWLCFVCYDIVLEGEPGRHRRRLKMYALMGPDHPPGKKAVVQPRVETE